MFNSHNKKPKKGQFTVSARFIVVAIVVLTTLLTASIAIGLQYYFSRSLAIESALSHYKATAKNTGDYIEAVERRATQVTRLLSMYPSLVNTDANHPNMRDLFAEIMRNNPIYYGIYIGFPNGDIYEVINLANSASARGFLKAKKSDRWVVNKVSNKGGQRVRQLYYYSEDFTLRSHREEASDYDVRQRSWFTQAMQGRVKKSEPYLFQYSQNPGQTYSIALPQKGLVLGLDITLQSFSDHLKGQSLNSRREVYVYRDSGAILASNLLAKNTKAIIKKRKSISLGLTAAERQYLSHLKTLKVSNENNWPPIDFAVAGQPKGYAIDIIKLVAQMLPLDIEFINGYSWPELVKKYQRKEVDIIQPVIDNATNRSRGIVSDAIINLPYAIAQTKTSPPITSILDLKGKTLAIPDGWSIISLIEKKYPSITIVKVKTTKDALLAVKSGKAVATIDSHAILQYTAKQYFIRGLVFRRAIDWGKVALPSSYHLVVSPKYKPLVPILNKALNHISPAQRLALRKKWFNAKAGGGADNLAIVPYKVLIDATQDASLRDRLLALKIKGKRYFAYIDPLFKHSGKLDYFAIVIPRQEVLATSLAKVKTSIWITVACLLLLLPVSWLLASPIVDPITRLNKKSTKIKQRRFNEVTHFPCVIREISDLSVSMVDMAEAIEHYQENQRQLMESFIELIAEAIDEKSPYTGGHCARVPELGLMIASVAEAQQQGPFASFAFASEDEHREFRIAAWLHDCGKITVPEHVVDKGSKLEAIYNRIHEVRMRFEVLWRDAEIAYWQGLNNSPEDKIHLQKALTKRREELQEDFAFVAQSNIGGEFFSEQDKARLQAIGKQTWQRFFDDRLGLSPVEQLRVKADAPPMPATEFLLADKPEHIIPRFRSVDYDPKFKIDMDIPENLYNLGEIYNLSISRGTLTAEDRFKINEHMISTIHMLERLPFPPELEKVPRYASTHHETLKGTGYPRKLAADDLSIPERILAVADIFEALTASDRPYKKAKPLSAAIKIMWFMVKDQHIDKDVFELFLTQGVYLDYAHRYLAEEQIDDVDITEYIS